MEHAPVPKATRDKRGGAGPVVRKDTIRLNHDVARRVRLGHPWIYKEAIERRTDNFSCGSVVELVDWEGEFVGRGLFDGETAISVRTLTRNPRVKIDADFWRTRVNAAIALRKQFFTAAPDQAIRLVNGESDGIPALVVDAYAGYLVVQIFSRAISPWTKGIYEALIDAWPVTSIYEQSRVKSLAGEAPKGAAELVYGPPAPVEVVVSESDLKFAVDVTAPLSTGLFLDLREGRRTVAKWSKGRRVLNLFSYTGAISVYASAGGATEVCSVDVAPKAHARARRNLELSGLNPETPEYITGDAIKILSKFCERGRQFDLIVLDPPAFASAQKGGKTWTLSKQYGELVEASLKLLPVGGVLIAASSTHKQSSAEFDGALAEGAMLAGTRLRVVERASLPIDFPVAVGFPEGNYLKFAVAVRA